MKHTHTLAAALAVAACGSTTGPHAPYMRMAAMTGTFVRCMCGRLTLLAGLRPREADMQERVPWKGQRDGPGGTDGG